MNNTAINFQTIAVLCNGNCLKYIVLKLMLCPSGIHHKKCQTNILSFCDCSSFNNALASFP